MYTVYRNQFGKCIRRFRAMTSTRLVVFALASVRAGAAARDKPHVIFVVGDDVGYSDFGTPPPLPPPLLAASDRERCYKIK